MSKVFYHNGSLGDIIYSLPTVQAMGGGIYVTGLPETQHKAVKSLLMQQPYITGVLHISDSGLPPGFVDLTLFRNHPLFTRKHIVELHADMQNIEILNYQGYNWKTGWLQNITPVTHVVGPYNVINITNRYRDRFFSWKKEIDFLRSSARFTYFLGTWKEFQQFGQHGGIMYQPTDTLLDAAEYIAGAQHFSGTQSSMLAIRQGLGMTYRFEQSPNHLDTEQGSGNETILNPITRRIHLFSVCVKKALFDNKITRYHA